MKKFILFAIAIVFGSWVWRRYEESGHLDLSEGCVRPRIDPSMRYGDWRDVETQDEDIFCATEGAVCSTLRQKWWRR